jgi:hypothetical protein
VSRSHRFLIFTLAVPLAAAGLVMARPDWAGREGLDFWNVSGDEQRLRAEQGEHERLERLAEFRRQRFELRRLVIQDLIDGCTTLAAASRRMLELNREEPNLLDVVRTSFPAASDEEAATLQTIATVRALLVHEPSRREDVMARLQAEQTAAREQPPSTK